MVHYNEILIIGSLAQWWISLHCFATALCLSKDQLHTWPSALVHSVWSLPLYKVRCFGTDEEVSSHLPLIKTSWWPSQCSCTGSPAVTGERDVCASDCKGWSLSGGASAAHSLYWRRIIIARTLGRLYAEKQRDSSCTKQLHELCASTRLLCANCIPRWPLAPGYLTCRLPKAQSADSALTPDSYRVTVTIPALPAALFRCGARLIFTP